MDLKPRDEIATIDDDHPDQDSDVDGAIAKIESTVIDNPIILERILDNPRVMAIVQKKESFRGPLPPPDFLQRYEEILPGGAERIFCLTEKEQSFRHDTHKTALEGAIKKDSRGQWMGFFLSISVLIIATYFAKDGAYWFAGTLITGNLVALAAVFAAGRKGSKSQDSSDSEETPN
ncbi:DUF2335 domain-containing protein [Providencia rettgeri]|uniref:DUF2335 domain-containing protein n=1 Tax=Providencia rettgeri TaxID=587 RepID=UPI0018E444D2|nr:DUF2335 domain-containing protein [Providencia rettgeri]MBI6188652.1 DUF2335 domain-containing protein [Providencia rettgeri]